MALVRPTPPNFQTWTNGARKLLPVALQKHRGLIRCQSIVWLTIALSVVHADDGSLNLRLPPLVHGSAGTTPLQQLRCCWIGGYFTEP